MKKYRIKFQKDSDCVKIGKDFYKKEDFCLFLEELEKEKKILARKRKNQGEVTTYYYLIDDEGKKIELDIFINREDSYFEDLKYISIPKKKIDFLLLAMRLYMGGLLISLFSTIFFSFKEPIYEYFSSKIIQEVTDEYEFFDSLFQTYMEQNPKLSKLETDTIEKFKDGDWTVKGKNDLLEKTQVYVEDLQIEETLDESLLKVYFINQKEYVHEPNFNFYDFERNTFMKEELVTYLYNYSLEHANDFYNDDYKVMSEEELYDLISYMEGYIFYMRKLDSNFDVEHFLCQILNTAFLKCEDYKEELKYINASTSQNVLGNCVLFNKYKVSDRYFPVKNIASHEFNHLSEAACICEDDEVRIYSSGFKIDEKSTYYLRFIREWASEAISQNANRSVNMDTYFNENEVIHNIEFALTIQPSYQCGEILDSSIKRDPFLLYQAFPYIHDEKQELTEYLEMLKCYDLSLSSLKNEPYVYYAEAKNIEIFYKNLFYLNESTDKELLEYNYFLINLFEISMREQNKTLNANVDIDTLLELGYQNLFYDYVKEKYPNASLEEMRSKNNYTVSELFEMDIREICLDYIDIDKVLFYEEIIKNLYYKDYGYDRSYIYTD